TRTEDRWFLGVRPNLSGNRLAQDQGFAIRQSGALLHSLLREAAERSNQMNDELLLEWLSLTADDASEAREIADEIKREGGSAERWDRADRTPALSAEVHNLVIGAMYGPSCHVTPREQLEQFRRYGDIGMKRGGKVWLR